MSERTDRVIEAYTGDTGMPAVEFRRIIRDHSIPKATRKARRLAEHLGDER